VCSLEEWINGFYAPVPFSAAEYKKKYEDIRGMLGTFEVKTRADGVIPKIQRDIFNAGWYVFPYSLLLPQLISQQCPRMH
jgi:hypothetical protein